MSTIIIYKADNGEFAWSLKDGNEAIIATGHETYTTYRDAARAVANVVHAVAYSVLEVDYGSLEGPVSARSFVEQYLREH